MTNNTMKNTISTYGMVRVVALTAGLFIASNMMTDAFAQEKGASLLLPPASSSVAHNPTHDHAAMKSCDQCKDSPVAATQHSGKGGRSETFTVVKHGCSSCSTKNDTVPAGKEAKNVIKHECKMEKHAHASCCDHGHN